MQLKIQKLMFNVIGSETCPVCLQGDSNIVGSQWEYVGSKPPDDCKEVKNEALGFELRKKMYFSADDLKRLGVRNLRYDDYVRASKLSNDKNVRQIERYFRPVCTDYSLFSDRLVYSLHPEEMGASISSMEVVRIVLNELQFPPIFIGLNVIIKDALLSHQATAVHMQEILKLRREKFHLVETIYVSFSSNQTLCEQFNLAFS